MIYLQNKNSLICLLTLYSSRPSYTYFILTNEFNKGFEYEIQCQFIKLATMCPCIMKV